MITEFNEEVILVRIGEANYSSSVGAINRAKLADGSDFRGLVNREGEEILSTATHKLLQIFLAVLSQKIAIKCHGEKQYA
jgi:hypothetical protein